jgi:hypothetical protein
VYLWFLPLCFSLHRGPWVQRAPGIPCALFDFEGGLLEKLGRIVPRDRCFISFIIPGRANGSGECAVDDGLRWNPE